MTEVARARSTSPRSNASGERAPAPASHKSFIYEALPARVVFGTGTLARVGEEIGKLRRERALILATPQQAAEAESLRGQLGALAVGVFAEAAMHTPVSVTERAMAAVAELRADVIVALGGGSTTGLGKAIVLRTDLPLIAIPTTYAGSEMTPILGETAGGKKTTTRDLKVLPEVVIYDVGLTLSLPVPLSVTSGMNAIAHAVEGLYARDRNPVVSLMALEGVRALATALPAIARNPRDADARSGALYGAWLCGTVLGSVGMALHHKLCHVLGGSFDLPHAETHTVVLPHATSFNAEAVPEQLAPLAELLGGDAPGRALFDLARTLGAPTALKDLGMPREGIERAATLAAEQPYWNPRAITNDGLCALLEDAWHGRRPSH